MITERRYGFVGRLILNVNHKFSSTRVSLFAATGDYFGFLVRNLQTGELVLPVQTGEGFALIAENPTSMMAAFPARLGNPEGNWLNVFAECDITDPAHMPSTGGMMEAMPHDNVTFDGLFLPERMQITTGTKLHNQTRMILRFEMRIQSRQERMIQRL